MKVRPALLVGLVFLTLVVVAGLSVYLIFEKTLTSLDVSLSSQIPKYQLSLNNKSFVAKKILLRRLYRKRGIDFAYDNALKIKGISVSLSDVGSADPFLSQDINIVDAFDTSGYDLINEPVGGHISFIDEGSNTLFVKFWLHPDSIDQGRYSKDDLAIWINARLFTFIDLITTKNITTDDIEQIEEPMLKSYTEKMKQLSTLGKLPITVD